MRRIVSGLRMLVLTSGVLVLLQPPAHGFRSDEVECEEAVARLQECCTSDDLAAVNCTYEAGCESITPNITVSESRCLRELSCKQVHQAEICERIATRAPNSERLCP